MRPRIDAPDRRFLRACRFAGVRRAAVVLACMLPWCLLPLPGAASAATGAASAAAPPVAGAAAPLAVGSKRFTESYVLGELLVQAARRAGAPATHRPGLGTTGIVVAALEAGEIDVYVEYTGTIARDVLRLPAETALDAPSRPAAAAPDAPSRPAATTDLDALNRRLAPRGLQAGVPLGFDNTYALAMRRERAQDLGIARVSDLAAHPQLRVGVTQEFLALPAGWPGLARAYGLAQVPVGIEHSLAYGALAAGRIDVKEVYTTDARLARHDLRVLDDDRRFFPRYDAVLLYRADLPARHPAAWAALQALAGRIDRATMIRLNAAAELEGRSFAEAARLFFEPRSGVRAGSAAATPGAPDQAGTTDRTATGTPLQPSRRALWPALAEGFWPRTAQHLLLVGVSLAAAVLVGVPLGVAAQRRPRLGAAILGATGVVQTVPSLALLALLIAATGRIGTLPALAALALYALLPIVRNTQAGLAAVGQGMRDAALALGLERRDMLLAIELPLAAPLVLAGIKTAAVLSVGTATIAAFVGAGGHGERIVQGLALNDATLLLAGALPSAGLALGAQALFDALERRLARRGAPIQ